MKPENIDFLESVYHHWVTLRDAQFLRGLNGNEREGMMRVMAEEFQPGYRTDLWCDSCVTGMVARLFTLYDKWKAEQPIVIAAAFPINEPTETDRRANMVRGNPDTFNDNKAGVDPDLVELRKNKHHHRK